MSESSSLTHSLPSAQSCNYFESQGHLIKATHIKATPTHDSKPLSNSPPFSYSSTKQKREKILHYNTTSLRFHLEGKCRSASKSAARSVTLCDSIRCSYDGATRRPCPVVVVYCPTYQQDTLRYQ